MTSVVANVKMPALFALTYKITGTEKTIYNGPVYVWKAVYVIACRVKNKMLLVEVSNEKQVYLLLQCLL